MFVFFKALIHNMASQTRSATTRYNHESLRRHSPGVGENRPGKVHQHDIDRTRRENAARSRSWPLAAFAATRSGSLQTTTT